jgi:SAM-dependent methyltransferase
LSRAHNIAPNRRAVHPFDAKHGTDTGGYLRPDEIRGGGGKDRADGMLMETDAANNGYSAVAPSVFCEALRLWRRTLVPSATRFEAYTFVDVGAGKGRAMLMAAESPFRRVIGVELSAELFRIAQANLSRWNRFALPRSKVRILHQDAMQFRWPHPPVLVFLNNPFECALVERLAANLAAAAARGPDLVDLIYVNPGCAAALTRQGNFRLLWDTQLQMDEGDRRADPFGAAADRVAAFRYAAKLH